MTEPNRARRVPLAVLDLVPIASGDDAAGALAKTLDLARAAESAGYARYWLAEHHLNPGIAGSAPHTLIAALGAATTSIRIGTAASVIGNYAPIQAAEAFGTAAALFGPRFDLGLGRSGTTSVAAAAAADPGGLGDTEPRPEPGGNRLVDGLVIPPPFAFPLDRERFLFQFALLGRVPGDADAFESSVDDVLAFLAGTRPGPGGDPVSVQPAEGSGVDVWVHGSTAGESARIAGARGLPYGANYHVAPARVLESVAEYRSHFEPGVLPAPHVIVSVDVVVASTDAEAHELALGYDLWVDSIRRGSGAVPYPTPDEARAAPLDANGRAAVQDRLDTRFVGSARTVTERLQTLQRVTGADELLVTTITHDHAARVRSYELLAAEWGIGDKAVAPAEGRRTLRAVG